MRGLTTFVALCNLAEHKVKKFQPPGAQQQQQQGISFLSFFFSFFSFLTHFLLLYTFSTSLSTFLFFFSVLYYYARSLSQQQQQCNLLHPSFSTFSPFSILFSPFSCIFYFSARYFEGWTTFVAILQSKVKFLRFSFIFFSFLFFSFFLSLTTFVCRNFNLLVLSSNIFSFLLFCLLFSLI